jgi:hypothetical protein
MQELMRQETADGQTCVGRFWGIQGKTQPSTTGMASPLLLMADGRREGIRLAGIGSKWMDYMRLLQQNPRKGPCVGATRISHACFIYNQDDP